jgi:tetrahydromethanopterin S-methyltransferase subunit C
VLALQAMVLLGSTPIGGPILGVVCEEFGARVGFLVGAVACFVAVAWGATAVRRAAEATSGSDVVATIPAGSAPSSARH